MISRLTDFVSRVAGSAKGRRFFKVRIDSPCTLKTLDGSVVGAAAGEEHIVTSEVAGEVSGRARILFECDRAGSQIVPDPDQEIQLPPDPAPAVASPFGESAWDRWHEMSERLRIARQRFRSLHERLMRLEGKGLAQSSDSPLLKRGRLRLERALESAKDAVERFPLDEFSALQLRLAREVLAELDVGRVEADALADRALELFELRVASLGLTKFYVASKLFGASQVYHKYVGDLPALLGPSRRLGYDADGIQADYSDEPVPQLWVHLKNAREFRALVKRLTKECAAELARAKSVMVAA